LTDKISDNVYSEAVLKVENKVEIIYCKQCRWLARSAWMAQKLLTTFDEEISELSLVPGTGGIFEVKVNNKILWSLKKEGRFPEIKELKKFVRDEIAPEKTLGHTDR